MASIVDKLKGTDLRSIGEANEVASMVHSQQAFDELFYCLSSGDRNLVMRSADAIEKITRQHPGFLSKHKKQLLLLCEEALNKELKWHLAQLLPRLTLKDYELGFAWNLLTSWALDKKESRIVRVNAMQGLFELLPQADDLLNDYKQTLGQMLRENLPSINARARKISKALHLQLN